MRPFEIVFDQPFGQGLVEYVRIAVEVPQIDEFFLERPVETFVVRIILGSSHPGIVLLDFEFLASLPEMFLKLASVVMPHPGHLAIQEEVEAQ